MIYPVSILSSKGSELTSLADRMNQLANEANSIDSAISRCYGAGGVGGRAGAVAGKMYSQSNKISHLGLVASMASSRYLAAEDGICSDVYKLSGETYTPRSPTGGYMAGGGGFSSTSGGANAFGGGGAGGGGIRDGGDPSAFETVKDIFHVGKKVFQTVGAVTSGVLAVAGCAASWAATVASGGAGAPVAVLSTAYAANQVYSSFSDIKNLWWGDESKVGEVNFLKDTMSEGMGELSVMLGGDREVGELIGKGLYSVGDIVTTVTNGEALSKLGPNLSKLSSDNPYVDTYSKLDNAFIDKYHLNLRSKIVQSDVDLDTVKKAVEEVPGAVSGLVDIAFNSPLSNVVSDYKLLSLQTENIREVFGMGKLLKETADVTMDVIDTGKDVVDYIKHID